MSLVDATDDWVQYITAKPIAEKPGKVFDLLVIGTVDVADRHPRSDLHSQSMWKGGYSEVNCCNLGLFS